MENQFVNFKIITRNSSGNRYRWIMLAAIVLSFTFILSYDDPMPRVWTLVVFIVMLVVVLVCSIKLQLIDEHDEIGWVMMTVDYLIVRLGNDDTEYPLDKTTTLTFVLRGYAGEPVIGEMIATKKGYGNFLSLTNADSTKKYEILVSNKMKISILDRLLGHYRRLGVSVKYVDQSSVDSKRSLFIRILMAIRQARG